MSTTNLPPNGQKTKPLTHFNSGFPLPELSDLPLPPEIQEVLVRSGYSVAGRFRTVGDLAANVANMRYVSEVLMTDLPHDVSGAINRMAVEIGQLRVALARLQTRPTPPGDGHIPFYANI